MRIKFNIKKIVLKIDPTYESCGYMQIKYKHYRHGRQFWFYNKTFRTLFKNIEHGYNFWQYFGYEYFKMFCYNSICIYHGYDKFIYLGGEEYELKN